MLWCQVTFIHRVKQPVGLFVSRFVDHEVMVQKICLNWLIIANYN